MCFPTKGFGVSLKSNTKLMECKLICSDIDGTLLDVNRRLSTETKAAVKRISPDIPSYSFLRACLNPCDCSKQNYEQLDCP